MTQVRDSTPTASAHVSSCLWDPFVRKWISVFATFNNHSPKECMTNMNKAVWISQSIYINPLSLSMSWLWTKFKGALYLLWIKLTYNDNHGIPTKFNANTTSLDARRPLVELSQCAYKYCVNLDDQVFKDDTGMLLRGGYTTVYSGILCRGNEVSGLSWQNFVITSWGHF